ncbi:AMP-binding protein [Enhygromyxa salina]|uniref:Long-chain-fatty-acid--CoA ligase FadD17 n=1 Tax=Enhygromyxa salina TaxID=215803 RepID=A0A2S9YN18_9BACT|nr:AMP-binding protein [Enhygromyxa salina]PRQ06487.1 Long-chain-fatty-acid--CoA ligase FadD17 [Enhygromyxa salina]
MIDRLISRIPSGPLRSRAHAAAGFMRMAREFRRLQPGGHWSSARVLDERARETPNAELLLFRGRAFSCSEMAALANRWAHLFHARGVRAGTCVALLLENGPTFLAALTALNRLGARAALLNPSLAPAGLAGCLAAVPVVGVVVDTRLRDRLGQALARQSDTSDSTPAPLRWITGGDASELEAGEEPVDAKLAELPSVAPRNLAWPRTDAIMCYVYTSGTSGLPKAAIITNARWLTGAAFMGRSLADAGPGDVIYCALPLYHGTALTGGWATAVVTGARLALRERFSASECLDDVRATGATIFLYIGELCRYWLAQPPTDHDRDHALRVAVGLGLRAELWTEFQARFGIPMIREMYGATEGNVAIANYEGRPGMLGRLASKQLIVQWDPEAGAPIRDASGRCRPVAVGQVGLLIAAITPTAAFEGYRDRKASERKILRGVLDPSDPSDRWFDSGDLLRLHEQGWVSFVDRVGDTFRWKGENVSTTEVETTLERAPGVREAMVYGVEIPRADGRAGMACVITEPEFNLDAFAAFVARELAPHQRPLLLRKTSSFATTATHRRLTRIYRDQGWDPGKVDDPMWLLVENRWLELTAERSARLRTHGLDTRPQETE